MIQQMKNSEKILELSEKVNTVVPGETKQIFVAFKNIEKTQKHFIIKGVRVSSLSKDTTNCGLYDENIIIEYKHKATEVPPGSTTVLPINIITSKNAKKDSCLFEILTESTENLVGYWNFNKNDAQDIINNNNGKTKKVDWNKVGKIEASYSFSSTEKNSIELPLVLGQGVKEDFTIALWTSISDLKATTPFKRILDLTKDNNNHFQIYIPYDNFIQTYIKKDSIEKVARIDNELIENVWYSIITTWNSTSNDLQLYLNGKLQSDKRLSNQALPGEINKINLGKKSQDLGHFDGIIDEVHIYNKVLSEEEIEQLNKGYNSPILLTVNIE